MSISWTACAAGPGWYNNLDQAMQVARQQNKPLFVDFSTSWCGVCKQMERTTLADPAVLSRLENFIKVKVDGDAFPQVCQAFGVEAYPTFVHLDSQGRMLSKREGGMRVREMAGALDQTMRTVSANTAIAQARQPSAPQPPAQQAADPSQPQIANTSLLHAPGSSPQPQNQTVSRELAAAAPPPARETQPAPSGNGASLYNMTSDPLQGNNVYDTEASSSARRSRFGGNNEGLRELAEATAQPESVRTLADAPAPATTAEPKDQTPPATEEAPKTTSRAEAPPAEETKTEPETKPAVTTTAKAQQPAPARETTSLSPSPVLETRLAGLSSESLPQPLLSRSASGVTEKLEPSREVASVAEVRRIPAAVKASTASAPDSTTTEVPPPAEAKNKTEIASAAPTRRISTSSTRTESKPTTAKTEEEKSSAGATKTDIERWMNEADSKLVEAHKTNNVQKKREARAMYNKVVEQDPESKFGKSDMAYVKMVSLIVDRDSDLLRRQAYTRIKEFETKFPNSTHKDYYTLIRAMLATDLDEITEARDLLNNYSEKFPDSKYQQVAEETLKSLPSGKKVTSRSTKR